MKKLYLILLLFVSFFAFSQNSGINFQGVGRNSTGAVLASQKISLRFSVVQGSETGTVEYVESKEVTTNAQGIFSVVIGDGTQISKTGNFTDINWKINPKFLRVEMDPAGGSSFAAMGTTRLQSVPFAYYANGVNADNVDGILSASKGGTGVASISALKTTLGVDQINNTSDLAKPISTATQTALDTKVSTATFSTTVATKANVTDVALKANASEVALKAPLESPTFTGTVSGITKAMVGLGSVDNTSDLTKPISTATQAALDTKVSTATFSTTMATKANVADVALKANASDVALKAPLESPTFTGTVSGITKSMVGLSNVENTADLAKPISTATQAALDSKVSTATFSSTLSTKANVADLALKAPIESPTFTGTVSGITKAMVGLSSVENTADLAKPISTATQEALDTKVSTATFSTTVVTKENTANKSTTTDLGGLNPSDVLFPTQKAVKTYVDTQVNAGGVANGGITTIKLADGSVTDAKVASGINKSKVGLGNVDNTADVDKPISTATQEALDEKLSAMVFDNRLRNIAKLDESNYFTSEQNIFSGNQIVIGELTLPNGILNLSAGTQILSGIDSPTTIQNRANKDFIIKTSINDEEYGDPGEYEFKFTADGRLVFPDGGSRIIIDESQFDDRNVFSIRSKKDSNIQLRTNSEGEEEGPDDDIINYWEFQTDGKITFPDGSTTMGLLSNPPFSVFEIKSSHGVSITSGAIDDITNKVARIDISPMSEEQGKIFITTEEITYPDGGITNTWIYDTEGRLTFPDGTSLAGNYSGSTYFELKTSEETYGFKILTNDNPQNPQAWEFNFEGILYFPDGTAMGKIALEGPEPEIEYQAFGLTSPNGIILRGGDPMSEETTGIASIGISQQGSQGKISIATQELMNDSNIWEFDYKGLLTFPDGTTLAGSYSGSTDFEFKIIENSGFKVSTFQNDGESKTLEFNVEGILTLPLVEMEPSDENLNEGAIAIAKPSGWDPLNKGGSVSYPVFYNGTDWVGLGSSVATGTSTPTSILYVDPITNTNYNTIIANENGFKFQVYQDGVGLEHEWSYNMDGSLTFPDGTIASGNISGTSNFGFDTRATENGLSIITPGTITGTSKLWEFKTDGVLNLPGSASVGMVYNLPYYFQEGLQITTPNAFILKSQNPGKVWRFEANGNTVFPRDLGIEGNLSQVNEITAVSLSASAINATNIITNNLNVTSEIKILNENILDKFVTDNITLDGQQLSYYNTNSTFTFALSASPRTIDKFKVAMYLNGIRVNPNKYTLSSSNLTYTKTQNETEVIAQFEYIKN
jgi:hypothetical protein